MTDHTDTQALDNLTILDSGRCAEVFEHSSDRVLKLYDTRFSRDWVERTSAFAADIASTGIAVPKVYGVETHGDRHGMVMERIDGVTLWEAVADQPDLAADYGRSLAELHVQIHQHTVDGLPDWVALLKEKVVEASHVDQPVRDQAAACLSRGSSSRKCLTHSDLHPGNIMIDDDNQLIAIDWDWPRTGTPALELARSHYLTDWWALAPGTNPAVNEVRQEMAAGFLATYQDLTGLTSSEIDQWRLPQLVARFAENIPEEHADLHSEIQRLNIPGL